MTLVALGVRSQGSVASKMAVHEVWRSREGQHARIDFVLDVTPHEGLIKRLLDHGLVFSERHGFLKKDQI